MDIFTQFCNICWNIDDKNMKNICESNMEYLKNTLITFIGHGEFINNTLYLCESCCDTLIYFNKFRNMCLSNLVELRQLYLKKISMLELRENLLLVEEALAKSKDTDSVSAYVQEFLRKYSDLNQILNSHAEQNEAEFNNSQLVSATDKLQTNETPKSGLEQLKSEVLEYESDESDNPDMQLTEGEVRVEEEISTSAALQVEQNDDGHATCQISNVCKVRNMEDYEDKDIRIEENDHAESQLRSGTYKLLHPTELSSSMESLSYDSSVASPGSSSGQHHNKRFLRKRTSFNDHQLRTMTSYFAINQNLDAKDLKRLVQETGLSKRVIQVWFQNARAKSRRNVMRQEGQNQSRVVGSGQGVSNSPSVAYMLAGDTNSMSHQPNFEDVHHLHG